MREDFPRREGFRNVADSCGLTATIQSTQTQVSHEEVVQQEKVPRQEEVCYRGV